MDKDLKLAGIQKTKPAGKVDFQACRIVFFTYILEAGATVKETQVLIRNSTLGLTINTYARTNDRRLTDLAEKVAERLLNWKECAKCVQKNLSDNLREIIERWLELSIGVRESIRLLIRSITK